MNGKSKILLDGPAIEKTIARLAHEVIEKNELEEVALIGIRSRGDHIAARIAKKLRLFPEEKYWWARLI